MNRGGNRRRIPRRNFNFGQRRQPNPPRRNPQAARAPATGPTSVITRKCNRIGKLSLNQSNPNGGTITFNTIGFQLQDIQGSDTLKDSYEQYRVRRIDVFMKPDVSNVSNLTTANQLVAMQVALQTMTVYSYIDYDTSSLPTEQTMLGRDQLRIKALDPHNFRLIASFTPRTKDNTTGVVYPANTWYSTDNDAIKFLGLAIRAAQDSDFWGTTLSTTAGVAVSYKYTLEFRGMKSQP